MPSKTEPTWTRERPTEPGHYWIIAPEWFGHAEAVLADVFPVDGVFYARINTYPEPLSGLSPYHLYGPIQPPEPPE